MKPSTKTKNRGECIIDGCGEPTYCCGLCSACYAWDHYWNKRKSAAERRHYIERQDRIKARVETIRNFTLRRVK